MTKKKNPVGCLYFLLENFVISPNSVCKRTRGTNIIATSYMYEINNFKAIRFNPIENNSDL